MIYSGQELPNNKRLKFFDKDQIEWKQDNELHEFYKTLLHLRKTNTALLAGDSGVDISKLNTDNDDKIFAFLRRNNEDEVLVILNLSTEKVILSILNTIVTGGFINIFNKTLIDFSEKQSIDINPWDYQVYEKEKA
jgi:glycosidase